jgi:hypothetical protein
MSEQPRQVEEVPREPRPMDWAPEISSEPYVRGVAALAAILAAMEGGQVQNQAPQPPAENG